MANRSYSSTVTTRRHLWKAFWSVQDVEKAGSFDSVATTDCDDLNSDTDFQQMCTVEFYGNSDLQSMSCSRSSKRAVISLRSDTGQISRHIIPYDRLLNATVVHIDHKENNLYVRPDIFEGKAMVLASRLSCIPYETLEPLGTRNVKIGQVYLVFSSATNSYARAVCGHMKYTHQNITRFQMYFVDDGRLEFIEQKDVFLLPFALGLVPPVCVPLDLANCTKSLAFSTCVDHFRSLQVGSRIVFALKNRVLDSEAGNGYISNQNENFPLTFTSKIFVGESVRFEITCPKQSERSIDNIGFNFGLLYDQWSSFSAFPSMAHQKNLPCDVTARVARRCDREGIYWMVDEKILKFIEEMLSQPTNFLSIDDTLLNFYPCIAYVSVGNDANHPTYCRALLRSLNVDCRRCSVFLVDYAKFVTCDVISLFTLEGQPQVVYETPGAAFLSVVQNRDSNGVVQQSRAYLCEGVTYSITLLSVDNEGIFCSSVFLPTVEDLLDDLKSRSVLVGQEPVTSNGSVVSCRNSGQSADSRVLYFSKKCCRDEKRTKEDEVLTEHLPPLFAFYRSSCSVKAALLKLEDKVTKYYDDLYRKLEILNIQDREMLREVSLQKNSTFIGRTKNSVFRFKPFARSDKVADSALNNTNHRLEDECCVLQKDFRSGFLEELRDTKVSILKEYETLVNQARNLSKERSRRLQVLRKHEGVQANGRSETAKVKEYNVEEFHRSEGSSSADSGIEHSDEHSPSPRASSPFSDTGVLKYKKKL